MGIPPQIPKEVLREIVSYLNRSDDLTPCPLSGVALSALYGHVDLRTFPWLDSAYVYDMEDSDSDADADADDDDDEEVLQDKSAGQDVISLKRQKNLISSLATNPNLGQLASAFSDGTQLHYFSDAAAPDSLTLDTIISAASSMTSLTSAKLTRNVLSACIISSLHSYPHLERLYVQNLSPFEVIWDSTKVTSLRSLKWRIPNVRRGPNGDEELRGIIRGIIGYIANVVRRTCPLLTELDIIIEDSFSDVGGEGYKLPDIPQQAIEGVEDRVRFYQDTTPDDESLTLGNLQHLGLQWKHYNIVDSQTWQLVERLIRQNSSTLTSLTIPSDLCDPILNSSIALKNLTSLSIAGTVRTPIIAEGITSRFGAQLERFSLSDTDTPFTASLGQTFGSWTRLKYLCIGDVEMAGGPYGNDGRPDFEAYDLMEFITHLPRGLEELHLRIHGYSLWLDEPSDFEPVCRLAGPIFRKLRCLHTCDILAYISNMDGGLSMEQPENAVHYRRLPHLRVGCGDADGGVSAASEEGPNKERRGLDTTSRTKDIWTSTMDSVYQDENNPLISHSCQTIEVDEDGDGDAGFEGRDAEGVWMGGETVFCGGDKTWPGQTGFRLWRYEEYVRAGSGKGV